MQYYILIHKIAAKKHGHSLMKKRENIHIYIYKIIQEQKTEIVKSREKGADLVNEKFICSWRFQRTPGEKWHLTIVIQNGFIKVTLSIFTTKETTESTRFKSEQDNERFALTGGK